MTIDLTDTSASAIYEALTEARRRLGGAALGMVLTLIVETSEAAQYDAMRAANQAATRASVPRARCNHAPPERRVAPRRGDPGGRNGPR